MALNWSSLLALDQGKHSTCNLLSMSPILYLRTDKVDVQHRMIETILTLTVDLRPGPDCSLTANAVVLDELLSSLHVPSQRTVLTP